MLWVISPKHGVARHSDDIRPSQKLRRSRTEVRILRVTLRLLECHRWLSDLVIRPELTSGFRNNLAQATGILIGVEEISASSGRNTDNQLRSLLARGKRTI